MVFNVVGNSLRILIRKLMKATAFGDNRRPCSKFSVKGHLL
jgi:hypothetical protein